MTLLFGIERCRVDSNGRFKLPMALKKQIGSEDCRFVVRQSVYADCLELWTFAGFEAEAEFLNQKLNRYSRSDMALLRQLMKCSQVELDSNDRLLIPAEQKKSIQTSKEIVLQSVGRFIEIWDYDKYTAMESANEQLAAQVDERLGNIATEADNATNNKE